MPTAASLYCCSLGNNHLAFLLELGEERLEGLFDCRWLGQAFGNHIKTGVEAFAAVPSE